MVIWPASIILRSCCVFRPGDTWPKGCWGMAIILTWALCRPRSICRCWRGKQNLNLWAGAKTRMRKMRSSMTGLETIGTARAFWQAVQQRTTTPKSWMLVFRGGVKCSRLCNWTNEIFDLFSLPAVQCI